MKTIGVRALRENPGVLSKSAALGEFVLVTNRNDPISLAIPFNEDLLKNGVHINLAVGFYEQGVLTLTKAAILAKMSVEKFMEVLGHHGIAVVEHSCDELDADLGNIGE